MTIRGSVCAALLARATARPVCERLEAAFAAHGVPDQVLTDNGKVFTARFGPGPGPTLFDRVCAQNGVRHLLTAPRSPTTTGKIERFPKTWRNEFVAVRDYQHATLAEAQAALDGWVVEYNTARPHQSLGDRPPMERFRLARARVEPVHVETGEIGGRRPLERAGPRPGGVTRWVDGNGRISVARYAYKVGRTFAGEMVEVVVSGGLVEIFHRQVLIATHVQRGQAALERPVRERPAPPRARRPSSGPSVIRVADGNGSISFAGTMYRAGRMWARRPITVNLLAGSVQLSVDGKVVRVHAARHDPNKEHGAFATPKGRPRRPQTASSVRGVKQVPEPNCKAGTGT